MSATPNDTTVLNDSLVPNDTLVPNETTALANATLPPPAPAPSAAYKKSVVMGASAIAEQAKKDAKKKIQNDKLAAKLSRKAAEKKHTKVTTMMHGLKEALKHADSNLVLSDMDISDEESPSLAIGTANRYALLEDTSLQQGTLSEPMITDDMLAGTQAADRQPRDAPLHPFPVTPTCADKHAMPGEEGATPGGEAVELDSFVHQHALSINFSSPPNNSPFLKSAAWIGLLGPNCTAFTAPTPDHDGDSIQELFPKLPDNAAPANPKPCNEPMPTETATPTSASDSRLLNRLQLAATYVPVPSPAQDVLNESEYTSGPFPTIHDPNPVQAIAFINEGQVLSWNCTPGRKFIACLFDPLHESRPHATIAAVLQQAVTKLMNSPKARVTTPISKYPHAAMGHTPSSFLVFNINEDAAKAMIAAGVWSSTALTFQAMELNPALPTYLFPVFGFADHVTDDRVVEIIQARWLENDSTLELRKLMEQYDDESGITALLTEKDIVTFFKTLTVSRLETKVSGGYPCPTHRLHADPMVLKAEHHLYVLRVHLRTLGYPTHHDSSGVPVTDFECPVCNSIDHPKGMCPFPDIPGWNGPHRYLEKKDKAVRGRTPMRGSERGGPKGRGAKHPY